MMQRRRQQVAVREQEEPRAAPVAINGPARQVRVIAGAEVQDMDIAGRNVAEARILARAILGIEAGARVLIDGHAATEGQVLGEGQLLEFVKHSGQKGAASGARKAENGTLGPSVIELVEDRASWRRGGRQLLATTVHDLFSRAAAAGCKLDNRLYPRHVRLMTERRRGHVTGVVIEMPPGPRQVRWISDDSSDPFGAQAGYADHYLSFPWVVLVIVFTDGELSNFQQAFFRTEPIASLDDELCYTNLLNVARGYGQESWVCLVNLEDRLASHTWEERIRTVTEHFWQAAFNRSSEVHEGNSYWGTTGKIDSRIESPSAWELATRDNPYFALGVRWRRAPYTLRQTLERMLDQVAPWRPIERVDDLVTLMQQKET